MKLNLDISWKKVLKTFTLVSIIFFMGFVVGTNEGQKYGFEEGYVRALTDVSDYTGMDFEWKELGDGSYEISVVSEGGLYAHGYVDTHLWVEHIRDGEVLSVEYGAGTLTTIGKNWIEQQLAESDGSQEALYCADSNDAGAPSAAWTQLPTEIAANGLDRQVGAYTSTGDGTWNVTVTKSVTGTQSTQLWGLHWITTDESDNNLLCADSGPAQKNCVDGDTLKETWQITVS